MWSKKALGVKNIERVHALIAIMATHSIGRGKLMRHANREAWLNHVARRMAPMFAALDAPLPGRIRIAIGFTSTGQRGKRIGECWDTSCSEDAHFEIFIRPDLVESADLMPMQVAAILAHELVHAAVGLDAGHRKPFRDVAVGIGLKGPMRSTTAGPRFEESVTPILDDAGPLPHARLRTRPDADSSDDGEAPGIKTTAPKKQTRRHIKCKCGSCGYTARTSRKWLDLVGAPLCPKHGAMAVCAQDDGQD
ncbi:MULTISPECIES: transcription elongation protein SprT [Ralstonia]|nr:MULTISPECIES: transcription elongation protein SprT [Ralstonia]